MSVLAVILPAFNEAEMLEDSTRRLVDGLRMIGNSFELRIVENGSTDGSAALAARLAQEIPEVIATSLPVADYGVALRQGLLDTTGEIAVIFNVDYFDLDFLRAGLASLGDPTSGPAMVLASKRDRDSRDRRPMTRRAGTLLFGALLRLAFGTRVRDTHGMKVLRLDRLRATILSCRMRADLFDSELVLRCERSRVPIVELPITVAETRPPRSSFARRIPRTLSGLVQLRAALHRAEREAERA